MKTVLITGGIGSGKSAASAYLQSKGIPVYDTDSRAKQLYYTDSEMVGEIESSLGIRIFDADGQLDRKALSDWLFSDPGHLARLEAIVHPAVLRDFLHWRSEQESRVQSDGGDIPFVCIESAIVLDKPVFKDIYDYVWVVDAPEELRLERAAKRDEAPKEKILERIRRQAVHLDQADVVIVNDGDLDTLYERVDQAIEILNL